MTPKQEYHSRKAAQEAKYKSKFLERSFSWWRTPTDRFAGLVAAFTALLFAATVGLWLATTDLVNDARDAGRAWIAPRYVSIVGSVRDGEPIAIQVEYENVGKTPAFDVAFRAEVQTITRNDGSSVPEEQYRNLKLGRNGACDAPINSNAGVSYPASNRVGSISNFSTAEPSVAEKVRTRKAILAIQGCYRYVTLGQPRKSLFCVYLEPTNGIPPERWPFRNCGDGADAN